VVICFNDDSVVRILFCNETVDGSILFIAEVKILRFCSNFACIDKKILIESFKAFAALSKSVVLD